jgi:hypothetical protein
VLIFLFVSDVVLHSLRERQACCLNIWKNVSFHETFFNWRVVIYVVMLSCDYYLFYVIFHFIVFLYLPYVPVLCLIGLEAVVPAHKL